MHTLPAPELLLDVLCRQSDSLKRPSSLWVHLLPYRWFQRLLSRRIKTKLEQLAQRHTVTALMLKGLHADVVAQLATPEWANDGAVDAIIDTLQQSEVHLLEIRAAYLDISPHVTHTALLRHTLATLIAANADAFEAAQTLRWELMELQADADIQAGRTHTFASADAAIAYLQ